ncbi:MAG: endopeptidase La, partial [Polaribacter sp.]|nr:endopeptidase La [Polaribacter sp.]
MSNAKILGLDSLSLHNMLDEDSELIPLMTPEDEEKINKEEIPAVLPILPLRNTVLFPGVEIPITAGRDASIQLIKDANAGDKILGVVAQKNAEVENPTENDIHKIGVVAQILRVLKMPDGNTTVIIQGKKRFEIDSVIQTEPYLKATTKAPVEVEIDEKNKEFDAIIDSIKEQALQIIKVNPMLPSEASFAIKNIKSNSFLVNFISSNMDLSVNEKQELLAQHNLKERALLTLKRLNKELQRLELKNDIQSKTRTDMDQQQREYYLHQQLKTIQEELGGVSNDEELEEMKQKSKTKKWTKEVAETFDKELSRLRRMNPQMAEYGIQRSYLELMLELPWGEFTEDKFDLKNAQKVLDREHFGLEKVKERIIEHLAVLKLRNDMKSPIICLYGPPGVGKTSLGESIARATNRKFVRMSLGGVRDEAEIRGHRRTYIGSMPGRILQKLSKSAVKNPLFLLDEIDKMGMDFRGDPASALLEVLDPEQNHTFNDHYLEVDFDLSDIMFVCTANSMNIPSALLDRMEIIRLPGYTEDEKVNIADKYLVSKQMKNNGLKEGEISIPKSSIKEIIRYFTREAGVRSLEREIAKICRKVVKKNADKKNIKKLSVKPSLLEDYCGVRKFDFGEAVEKDRIGQVTGLA